MPLKSILFGCFTRQHHAEEEASIVPVSQRNASTANPLRIKSNDPLTALPDDLLLIIFDRLSLNEVQSMQLVHSRFNPITIKAFNRRLVHLKCPIFSSEDLSIRLSSIIAEHNELSKTAYAPFARVLTVDFADKTLERQLSALTYAPLAKRVVLKNLNQIPNHIGAYALSIKLEELAELEHLSFDNACLPGNYVADAISIIKLKSFSWHFNAPPYKADVSKVIFALAFSSPHLEKLEFHGTFNFEAVLNQEYSINILSKNFPNITKLRLLGNFTFSLNTVKVIEKLFKKNLRELGFSSEDLTTANVQWITLKCPKLQKLTLDFMNKPINDENKVLAAIFSNLKDLRVLKLINVENSARGQLFNNACTFANAHNKIIKVSIGRAFPKESLILRVKRPQPSRLDQLGGNS